MLSEMHYEVCCCYGRHRQCQHILNAAQTRVLFQIKSILLLISVLTMRMSIHNKLAIVATDYCLKVFPVIEVMI